MEISELAGKIKSVASHINILNQQIEALSVDTTPTLRVFVEAIQAWFDEDSEDVIKRITESRDKNQAEHDKLVALQAMLQQTLSDALKG